mmetsp:Transcript_20164/g.59596  ORF Transcript_20164/g.59596 Transcript_20164/m.59596 type:complete len:338 (-) Transcript_20164:1248-2261(-)
MCGHRDPLRLPRVEHAGVARAEPVARARQPHDGEQRAVRAAEHLDEVVRVLEVVPHEEAHEARPRHAHREGAVGQVAVARVLLAGAQRAARRAEVARLARRHDVAQAAARIRAVGARVPARAVAEAVGAAHAAVAVLPARAAARVCAEAQREVRRPVHGDGAVRAQRRPRPAAPAELREKGRVPVPPGQRKELFARPHLDGRVEQHLDDLGGRGGADDPVAVVALAELAEVGGGGEADTVVLHVEVGADSGGAAPNVVPHRAPDRAVRRRHNLSPLLALAALRRLQVRVEDRHRRAREGRLARPCGSGVLRRRHQRDASLSRRRGKAAASRSLLRPP